MCCRYLHIISNLIFQSVIGLPLEMVHKWWRVGIVYSLGVIAGARTHQPRDVLVTSLFAERSVQRMQYS